MTTFVKRQNEFDGVQFTGGVESAAVVQKWLQEHFKLNSSYIRNTPPPEGNTQEWIAIERGRDSRIYPGYWVTMDAWHGELTFFTEDEFEKMFVPLQDLEPTDMAEESFTEAALQYTQDGIEESKVSDHVHTEAGERLTEINNGIIDSVPGPFQGIYLEAIRELVELIRDSEHPITINVYDNSPAMHKKILDDVIIGMGALSGETHTEDTLMKARKAIEKLTERQPYTNVRRVVTGVTVDDIIMALQNAGILFRERV